MSRFSSRLRFRMLPKCFAYWPVCSSINCAPDLAAASTCLASGLINRLTSISALFMRLQTLMIARNWPATSSPPSVVTSSRFSGTRQTMPGCSLSANRTIFGAMDISKFRRVLTSLRSDFTSASRMCRRSSRRCAVMPCAPAASQVSAASTGLGSPFLIPRYRASRRVATWSIFTPSLSTGNVTQKSHGLPTSSSLVRI